MATQDEEPAETQLGRSLVALAEVASDLLLTLAPDDTIVWVSRSSTTLLGIDPNDLVGTALEDLLHPEDRARVSATGRDGGPPAGEVRLRRADGRWRWVSLRLEAIDGERGPTAFRVGVAQDVHSLVEGRERLRAAEQRFRTLAENASDVVYEAGADRRIRWVSPSVERVLGWAPEEVLGRRADELVVEEDVARTAEAREAAYRGRPSRSTAVRWRCGNGEVRWCIVRAQPLSDDGGEVSALVVALRDVQAEIVSERAARTLLAGTAAMVDADDEHELLAEMCRIAVVEGGYRFAWYGRPADDALRTVRSVACSPEDISYLDELLVSWADDFQGIGPVGRAAREHAAVRVDDISEEPGVAEWVSAAAAEGFRSVIALPVLLDGELDGVLAVYAREPSAFTDEAAASLNRLTLLLGQGLVRMRNERRISAALDELALLTTAIEQSGESVLVTGPGDRILYANPYAATSTGYTVEELVGAPAALLAGDADAVERVGGMSSSVSRGRRWRGVVSTRRKDGSLFEEDVTVQPVRDADGAVVSYVLLKRDLSEQRRLERDLDRREADRATVLTVMEQVRSGERLQDTAEELCESLCGIDGVDGAALMALAGDRLELLAFAGTPVTGRSGAGHLAVPNVEHLVERMADQVWILDLVRDEVEPLLGASMTELLRRGGATATGTVGLTHEGGLLGVLTVVTRLDDGARLLDARRPLLLQLGSYAASVLGTQVADEVRRERLRATLATIIERSAFVPAFQPVVDLTNRAVVGFEALTRFADGTRPDLRFAEAHAVGMGLQLEMACLGASLAAADRGLPSSAYLSVNVSPALAVEPALGELLGVSARRLVVEITEHAEIPDYPRLREALARSGCDISVDDAGAGYSSLQHILELRPGYVKLDISLVRGIHLDPARQAMAAGLAHFAREMGVTLVGEGIEQEDEAVVLAELGVACGQGYLFGRPAPVEAWIT